MMMILLIFAFVFVFGPIARAYAKRLDGSLPPGAPPAELGRLREEVDRLSAEVARLSDEQSFMVRLLADGERQRLSTRTPRPDSPDVPPRTPEP